MAYLILFLHCKMLEKLKKFLVGLQVRKNVTHNIRHIYMSFQI